MVDLRRVVAVAVAVLCVSGARDVAAEQSEFDGIVGQALERYQAREFLEAADLFMRAFELREEPELIFNTARAYERAGESERAIEAYERFLALDNTTAQLRARAAENLGALRQEMAARDRAARLAEEERLRREGGGGEGGGGEGGGGEGGGGEGIEPGPTPEERTARALSITGWTLVGVGAAALIGAGVTAGVAYSGWNEFYDMSVQDDRAAVRDRVEGQSLAADVLFGVGGAAAAAGIVILVVQAVQSAEPETEGEEGAEPEVAFMPTMSPGGGVALTAVGRF